MAGNMKCCFAVVPKELCTEKLVCYLVALTTFSITSMVFIDFSLA